MTKGEVMALLGVKASSIKQKKHVGASVDISDPPVKSHAQIASHDERRKTIRIHVEVEDGWYLYGKPLLFPYISPLSVDIRGSAIQEVLEIKLPSPRQRQTDRKNIPVNIYQGKIMIEAKLLVKKETARSGAEDKIRVLLRYQPCSDDRCLAPVNTAYKV